MAQSWFIYFDLEDYVSKHICDADMSYKIRDMKSCRETRNIVIIILKRDSGVNLKNSF